MSKMENAMDDDFVGLPYEDDGSVPIDPIREAAFRERIRGPSRIALDDHCVQAAVCRVEESWVYDSVYPGLALRLQRNGQKTYIYLWQRTIAAGSRREV